MAKPKLTAVVTADSSGFQAGMAKANKSLGNLEKTSKSMAKNMKLLGAAVLAAVGVIAVKAAKKIIKFGKDLTVLGQKSLSLKKSFESLAKAAGASSKKMLADMKRATRGTIAEVDLLATANRMMLLGLDTSIFDEVMEIARRTAKATGQDINYMVESLSMGLGRQSKMILDNLGIVFQTSEAYEWYAETLGKTSSQLTENEKRLGFQTYAMKIAQENVEKLGEDTLTLTEVGGIFTAKWADLRAFIGEKLVGAIGAVIEKFGGWEKIMGTVDNFIENNIKKTIEALIKKVIEFGTKLAEADYSEFIEASKGFAESLGDIIETLTTLGGKVEESKSDFAGFIKILSIAGKILQKIGQFINIIFIGMESMAAVIAWAILPIFEKIKAFLVGFTEKSGTFTEKLISGLVNVSLQSDRFDELSKKGMEAVETIGKDLVGAVEKFIGIEILPKEIIIDHSFDKVETDYQELVRELKDIKRTVTYSIRTVGGLPTGAGWTGLRKYQFGGIVTKTQSILAHGGEMMLTTEMQRNLLALLKKPRNISYAYSTPITIQGLSIREEADIYKLADQLYELQVKTQRGGGLK